MFGYCATGRRAMETRPTMTVMMAMTIATIGRLMKNCDMVGWCGARQAGVAEASGNGVGVGTGVAAGTTGTAGAGAPSKAASGGSIM